ncbi:MAG: hypothetical protein PGN13_16025 [Patulibacter minatonensis]
MTLDPITRATSAVSFRDRINSLISSVSALLALRPVGEAAAGANYTSGSNGTIAIGAITQSGSTYALRDSNKSIEVAEAGIYSVSAFVVRDDSSPTTVTIRRKSDQATIAEYARAGDGVPVSGVRRLAAGDRVEVYATLTSPGHLAWLIIERIGL